MTLVKVRPKFVQIRELAGDGICPGTQIVILSNDTIKEQDERRRFSHR